MVRRTLRPTAGIWKGSAQQRLCRSRATVQKLKKTKKETSKSVRVQYREVRVKQSPKNFEKKKKKKKISVKEKSPSHLISSHPTT